MPKGRLEKIEATVLGISEKADRLRAAGQHLSRGVLLYGPPGTGKTLTIRYLLSQARDTTAILLQGEALSKIRATASAAQAIGRAIIVLEDADLVAEDRDFNEGECSVLFEILDVLDELGDDADITFVLTTNRVDVLEEAIAKRPGRIDLAVEVPLPSTKLRRRLFAVYGNDFAFTEEGIAKAAKAAEGTSGSFAKEAVRRAVILAIEAGEDPRDNHLLEAVAALTAEATQLREAMTSDEGWDE
ncbi:ATP-binding protein [Brevibacterium aurantiacum]|uniref:AAA family ATPase n=1 Tax=Brevibacterium aurantiacum TaxID=273384 RepID=UPI0016425235|nr:ATP-binding protein [Brevibacterium aurantiacum]